MIKSLEAQGLQLAKEKQEYLGWLEGWTGSWGSLGSKLSRAEARAGLGGGPRKGKVRGAELSGLQGARDQPAA